MRLKTALMGAGLYSSLQKIVLQDTLLHCCSFDTLFMKS